MSQLFLAHDQPFFLDSRVTSSSFPASTIGIIFLIISLHNEVDDDLAGIF